MDDGTGPVQTLEPADALELANTIELPVVPDQRDTAGQPEATERPDVTAQPGSLPPLTAEAARRLAATLAPHLLAMRAVTAGTRYGAGEDAGSRSAAQRPQASAATKIFIAGMLERISA
jgi:hypothetical protein